MAKCRETCKQCKYFDSEDYNKTFLQGVGEIQIGLCHRYPYNAIDNRDNKVVTEISWCGEFAMQGA